MLKSLARFVVLVGVAISSPMALADDWSRYEVQDLGFRVDIPMHLFQPSSDRSLPSTQSFEATEGGGELTVFASLNTQELTPSELMATMAESGDITYRRSGRNWFVLSGYYDQEEGDEEPTIFYAKFMFDRNRDAFAGFEIAFPLSEKPRFEDAVERMEDSMRSPSIQD